jgi:hypothetical protein
MKRLVASVIAATSLSAAAQGPQTFTGVISDEMCARDGHARMRMGPTDAECTRACVMHHDAKYVLEDGADVYVLSDQKQPDALAGQRVRVVGTLDAKTKTIRVESISAVSPAA